MATTWHGDLHQADDVGNRASAFRFLERYESGILGTLIHGPFLAKRINRLP